MAGVQIQLGEHLGVHLAGEPLLHLGVHLAGELLVHLEEHLAGELLVHLGVHLTEVHLVHLGEHLVLREAQVQQEVPPLQMVMLQGEHLLSKEETVCKDHLMEEVEIRLVLAEEWPNG